MYALSLIPHPKSGSRGHKRPPFREIIRKSPDDYITFDADENMNVKITYGPSEFSIMGLSAGDYPDLPAPEREISELTRRHLT